MVRDDENVRRKIIDLLIRWRRSIWDQSSRTWCSSTVSNSVWHRYDVSTSNIITVNWPENEWQDATARVFNQWKRFERKVNAREKETNISTVTLRLRWFDSHHLFGDFSSSCSINIDPSHAWSFNKSNTHRSSTHHALSTIIQDFGERSRILARRRRFSSVSSPSSDEHDRSKFHLQQHEYESQLVHNIILNLLKRRYELHTVHEKKDRVSSFPFLPRSKEKRSFNLELERDVDRRSEIGLSEFDRSHFDSRLGGKTVSADEIVRSARRSRHADE